MQHSHQKVSQWSMHVDQALHSTCTPNINSRESSISSCVRVKVVINMAHALNIVIYPIFHTTMAQKIILCMTKAGVYSCMHEPLRMHHAKRLRVRIGPVSTIRLQAFHVHMCITPLSLQENHGSCGKKPEKGVRQLITPHEYATCAIRTNEDTLLANSV